MIKKECCGREYFEEDEKCTECGNPLVAKDVCDSCGEPLDSNSDAVCLVCGAEQAEIPGYDEDTYQPIVTPEDGEVAEDLSDSVVFAEPVKKSKTKLILTIWASVATAAAIALAVIFIVLPIFTNTIVGKWYMNSASTAAAEAVIVEVKNNGTFSITQPGSPATTGKYTLSKKGGQNFMYLTAKDTKDKIETYYFVKGKILHLVFKGQQGQGDVIYKFVKK
jgi:hypothetical protein